MAPTYAWQGPNRAAVAFPAARVATANPSGDAQPPSAPETLGDGGGGRRGVPVAGPAAPVATTGAPCPTRGRGGAGTLGGRPLAAPPLCPIETAAEGASCRSPRRLLRSVLPPSRVRWLETISANDVRLIQVPTSIFITKPDYCLAGLQLGRSSKIRVEIDSCQCTIVMSPHAIISS